MKTALFAILFLLSVFFQQRAEKNFTFSNTELFSKAFAGVARYSDFWLVLFGHRRIASDIAFMEMLQYYGGIHKDEIIPGAKPEWGSGFGTGLVSYGGFFDRALRCTRLDRNFDFAVTFSAAALAWVEKKDKQAVALLADALKFRPDFYEASLYLSAITVRKNTGSEESVKYMEKALKYPNCPDMVKNILAAIYEKRGDYRNAVRIWIMNVNSRNAYYRKAAREGIEKYTGYKIKGIAK